jgi:hypothetical protein
MSLIKIQQELKVPKGNYNSFGKYKYRSCEDILEALKPLLTKHSAILTISDSIELLGSNLISKATAKIIIEEKEYTSFGFAGIAEHKGMSVEQCYGTASSYSRKYALNGLFLIDETQQDPDASADVKLNEAIAKVNNSKSIVELEILWNEFKDFQKNEKFVSAVKIKKES